MRHQICVFVIVKSLVIIVILFIQQMPNLYILCCSSLCLNKHSVFRWGHFNEKRKIPIGWFVLLTLFPWLNKQTDLKGRHNLYCFNLFMCGGPCHLSSFKQCSGALFSLWEQLVCCCFTVLFPIQMTTVGWSWGHWLGRTPNTQTTSMPTMWM